MNVWHANVDVNIVMIWQAKIMIISCNNIRREHSHKALPTKLVRIKVKMSKCVWQLFNHHAVRLHKQNKSSGASSVLYEIIISPADRSHVFGMRVLGISASSM